MRGRKIWESRGNKGWVRREMSGGKVGEMTEHEGLERRKSEEK